MKLSPVTILLTALGATLLSACVHKTEVASASGALPSDVVVVVGEGEARGKPDIVKLQLGVEARARDANAAVESANAQMQRLVEALKQSGVKPEDLQTRDFNIHSEQIETGMLEPMEPMAAGGGESAAAPKHEAAMAPSTARSGATTRVEPMPPAPPGPPDGRRRTELVYRVSNMLQVTLRDLGKVGEVLNKAVQAGANQAWGVSFEIEDEKPLAQQARGEAVANARKQASELAQLAGVRLGHIVSIMDEDSGGFVPMPAMGLARAEMSKVPIESGELMVRHRVRVVFAIERKKE